MHCWNSHAQFVQSASRLPLLFFSLIVSLFACADTAEESGSCPGGYARDGQRVCRPEQTFNNETLSDWLSEDVGDEMFDPMPIDEHLDAVSVPEDAQPTCLPFGGNVQITEVFANPEGPDGDFEFIELLISGESEGDIQLKAFNGNENEPYWSMEIPIRNVAAETPGSTPSTFRRFVVGRAQSPHGVRLPCTAAGGCLQNGPDRLTVATCDGELLDDVQYPALASGVSYAMCELATLPEAGEFSLAEESAGEPGSAFHPESFCRVPCTPLTDFEARIEQVFINPEGSDAGYEFVVVRTEPGVDASELELLGFDGETDRIWLGPLTLGDTVSDDGIFVLAGREISASHSTITTSLQNGPDGLQLLSCGDVVIDEITWGDTPSAMIESPQIPLPLDNELWVRCTETEWWSLIIGKGAGPLDSVQLKEVCDDAELSSEPME